MIEVVRCFRSRCQARIYRVKHLRTGGTAPIDAEPADNGNILVDTETGGYVVLAGDDLAKARAAGDQLHLNHWVTCVDPPARGGRS